MAFLATISSAASFRDVRLVGEGAQARVYLVEHEGTGERCVVKRCTMSSPSAAEQALRQAYGNGLQFVL